VDFGTLMKLEPHGPDTFVGTGPQYPWGGLYGGQIVAQALRAAANTVDEGFLPHSLHAYFIRAGDQDKPVRFEVDRVRDGRSFATRSVTVRQPVGAIFNLSASFQAEGGNGETFVQTAEMPAFPLPGPERSGSWTPIFDRRANPDKARGELTCWFRMVDPVGDDPVDRACALAYMSDDLPTETVITLHPDGPDPENFFQKHFSASLDHAIWFHRPLDVNAWHVEHVVCHGLLGSRGFTLGYVFDGDGNHVATVSQEVLFRPLRR
jgi:acyl-CoA thioesterase II